MTDQQTTWEFPTLDEAIARFQPGESASVIDQRDATRFSGFIPTARWGEIGLTLRANVTAEQRAEQDATMTPWTLDAVLAQVRRDVRFAFEKATAERGISASLMWDVLRMWAMILRPPFDWESIDYPPYGMPLIRAWDQFLELGVTSAGGA